MKIYRITVKKVMATLGTISSSYVSERTTIKTLYYIDDGKAHKERQSLLDAMKTLGTSDYEITIDAIEVIE
jgi:hypothetical protein